MVKCSFDGFTLNKSSGLGNQPHHIADPMNFKSGQGDLTYSVLGNVGGQIGYRLSQFRVEGELLYNYNPYKHLTVDGMNIPASGSTTTSGSPFSFSGYTSTYALMLNGFYDIYIPGYTEHFVPYIGLGVGYEQVKNSFTLGNDGSNSPDYTASTMGFNNTKNNPAGQAIIGLSYFLSDYTAFSLDYRYLSSFDTDLVSSRAMSLQSRPQLYSVNFVFNSAFNVG